MVRVKVFEVLEVRQLLAAVTQTSLAEAASSAQEIRSTLESQTLVSSFQTGTTPNAFATAAVGGQFIPLGPFSATNGQTENVSPNNQVVGAIHTVVAHPTNADLLYIGATNGGVWRTDNATSPSPNWIPLTDSLPSGSIGALELDLSDPTGNTIYAGTGRFSSFGRRGTDRVGIYKSIDGGQSWTILDDRLAGGNISGIAAHGDNIVVSVNTADSFSFANLGIFRSTDGGNTFTQVSLGDGSTTGLPGGISFDLVADPVTPSTLYTSIVNAAAGGSNGLYKSIDSGESWTRISNPAIEAIIQSFSTSNLELSVGRQNNVYAAIVNNGNLAGLFRSGDGGSNWTQLDTPSTNEGGTDVGLNPRGVKGPGPDDKVAPEEIAGGQGSIHFSLLADPGDPNILYIGGDRQPRANGDTGGFPNSIGANNFTGRLFRGDASQPAGSQFVHLTHRNDRGPAGGGTANNSAPHADSREMVFDAQGDLIEVDDGGIYRRTSPRDNTGRWLGINGDLQVTEAHDIAYDSLSNTVTTGNQDTGTTYQPNSSARTFVSLSTADGGDVAIDNVSRAAQNQSVRYTSFQNLGAFRRTIYNATGTLIGTSFPALTGFDDDGVFRTPVEVNRIDPNRLLIQGGTQTYESFNQGSSVVGLGEAPNLSSTQNAVVYGGRSGGVDNPDLLYVGSGSDVYVRTDSTQPLAETASDPTGQTIVDLTVDPDDWNSVFTIDFNSVFASFDVGANWSDITGDLLSLGGRLSSINFVSSDIGDAVIVGTDSGIFQSVVGALGTWTALGSGLPNVLAFDLDYNAADDVLVVGTLGRGAWALSNVTDLIAVDSDINQPVNPFERIAPLGSLAAQSAGNTGGLISDLDVDTFELTAQAGETIAAELAITRLDSSISIELVGQSSVFSSPSPGQSAILPPTTVSEDGTYEIRISGSGGTTYNLEVFRNAILESAVGDTEQDAGLSINDPSISSSGNPIGSPATGTNASGTDVTGASQFLVVGSSDGFRQLQFDRTANRPQDFIDISQTGTPLNLADEQTANIQTTVGNAFFPAGFVTVDDNGGVQAGSNQRLGFINEALPANSVGNALFPFWDDLDGTAGNVFWEEREVSGVNTLIVQWNDRPRFSDLGNATFQLQLFESGPDTLRYAYRDVNFGSEFVDQGNDATVGLQLDNENAVQFSFNQPTLSDDDVLDLTEVFQLDVDEYVIDLSDQVGQSVDIVLAGTSGESFQSSTLQLIAPDESVVATAVADTASNFDLGILNYPIGEIGNNQYRLRLSSEVTGEYSIAINQRLVFDTEPNENNSGENITGGPLRDLSETAAAIGYLDSDGGSDVVDAYRVTLIADQSVTLVTGTPLDGPGANPSNNLDLSLSIRALGSTAPLASDDDGASDGKNAELGFTAPESGDYVIEIAATSGQGEYTLAIDGLLSKLNDFGDAPAPYATLSSENGARHRSVGPQLGAGRDTESDGAVSPLADGDDVGGELRNADDEDGVLFGFIPETTSATGLAALNIDLQNASAARLDAWIDFNGDGDWDDPGEQIFTDQGVTDETTTLNYAVPADVDAQITFARVRISTAGGLSPVGPASDGEVEDYAVTIGSDLADVGEVTLNAGRSTRSEITSIEVQFDSVVEAVASDFQLINVDPISGTSQPIRGINVQLNNDGPTTLAILTFTSGPGIISGGNPGLAPTLGNGEYQLRYRPSALDGTGLAIPVDNFFRQYGETDSDDSSNTVGLVDFAAFRGTFGTQFNPADLDNGFRSDLDSDRDGRIGLSDFAAFRAGFGN